MSVQESPMTSRKFLAYLIAEITWKAIIVLLILSKDKLGDNLILLTIVLIAGFIEVSYVLGQAYVDRYMKIADNAFDKVGNAVEAVMPGGSDKDSEAHKDPKTKSDAEPSDSKDPVEPKKEEPVKRKR